MEAQGERPSGPHHTALTYGLPPLFLSLSLAPSCTERGLVRICAHSRLHIQALFIPTLKAVALPPLRPRGVHTSGTIFLRGTDEKRHKRHEQVLEASSGLFGQGMLDWSLLSREEYGLLLALAL